MPAGSAAADDDGSDLGSYRTLLGFLKAVPEPRRRHGRLSEQKRRGLTRDSGPPRQQPDIQRRGLITYTPEEREALTLDILRLVLGADDQEILDYRHARGIGADAIDIHKRYFELKTAIGPPSDEVTHTANEAERAYRDRETFFLAVVSGLEEGEQTEVRLIEQPLETLDWKPQTNVTLSGVLRKPALHIVLTEHPAS